MGLCEAHTPWLHLLLVSFFTEEFGALLPGRAGRELGNVV